MVKKCAKVELKTFKVKEISDATYNPRTITALAVRALTTSMERFGLISLPVVNVEGKKPTLIAGHKRVSILREKGIDEVTCIVVRFPVEKEKLANMTLNNEAIQGDFIPEDTVRIMERIKQLTAPDDLRLKTLRIDTLVKEMRRQLGVQPSHASAKTTDGKISKSGSVAVSVDLIDYIPAITQTDATSKLGSSYSMGNHTLYCQKPSENVTFPTKVDCALAMLRSAKPLSEAYINFALSTMFANTDGLVYCMTDGKNLARVQSRFIAMGGHWSSTLLWYPPTTKGTGLSALAVPIVFGWRAGATYKFNGPKNIGNIFSMFSSAGAFSVEIPELILKHATDKGGSVLSIGYDKGASLIAAEITGRKWLGIAESPRNASTLRKRWAIYTNGKDVDWAAETPEA